MNKNTSSTEQAVLGCMLLDGTLSVDTFTRSGGRADWFTPGAARKTATAILELHSEGRPVDALTVGRRCKDVPSAWRDDCIDAAITTAHAGFYCEQLRGTVMVREAETVLSAASERIHNVAPENAAAALAEIVESLHAVCRGHEENPGTMGDVAEGVIARWTDGKQHAEFLPWPVERIVRAMGGIEDELVWLVSQPSNGKTAFALQWSAELAQAGFPVSFASLESPRDRIASRLIAYLGRVDTLAMKRGTATAADIGAAQGAAETLKTLPLRVTSAGMTLEQVYAWGRSEAQRGARLLVIDNTRHIRRAGGTDSRVEWMGHLSARLKQLRDDTGLPVLVLHHSTRADERGRDDVSWSSDIRRDADCLVFLREDKNRTELPTGPGEAGRFCVRFEVEKNRDGIRGVRVPLDFVKWRQAFEEWDAN